MWRGVGPRVYPRRSAILSGFTKEFITARMENMGRCHEQLVTLVWEQEATKALAQALEQAGNEPTSVEKEAAQ